MALGLVHWDPGHIFTVAGHPAADRSTVLRSRVATFAVIDRCERGWELVVGLRRLIRQEVLPGIHLHMHGIGRVVPGSRLPDQSKHNRISSVSTSDSHHVSLDLRVGRVIDPHETTPHSDLG